MTWIDWGILVAQGRPRLLRAAHAVMLFIWMERKVIADMQTRIGPMRAGPRGVLMTLADGIKLFFKEGIRAEPGRPRVYLLAPVVRDGPRVPRVRVMPVRRRRCTSSAGRSVSS